MRKRSDKHNIYMRAFFNTIDIVQADNNISVDNAKKLALYGLKTVISKPKEDLQGTEWTFNFTETVKGIMSLLTPLEFMNVFPVSKQYDGKKYQCKDYFYTMNYIQSLNIEEKIGDKIFDFLWEYDNLEIRLFVVSSMCAMSELRRSMGERGIMEEFCQEHGVATYTSFERNGNQYFKNNQTGEITKAKKQFPKYLKVIEL